MKMIVNSAGQNFGPYNVAQIRQLLKEGSIQENDFAWCDNATEWTTVGKAFAGLRPVMRAAPVRRSRSVRSSQGARPEPVMQTVPVSSDVTPKRSKRAGMDGRWQSSGIWASKY